MVSGVMAGKIVVVTGSSSGIGRAMALAFASAGAKVVVHSRSSTGRAQAVLRDVAQLGVEAKVVTADLSQEEGRASLADDAWDAFGHVDCWVNNAGADVLTGEAASWSYAKKLELLWQVDVLGTLELSRAIGAKMLSNKREGTIINIGWDQASQGMAGDSGEMFATTKGAIMAFSRSLAQSLAPKVRVNCIAPGWIKTAWGDEASEYWQSRALKESLRERWGSGDDIAKAALFLASSNADFITGQVLNVNGGFRYSRETKK